MTNMEEVPFYNKSVDETVKLLDTNMKTGLTNVKAQALLNTYGYNELDKEEGESIWTKIKE